MPNNPDILTVAREVLAHWEQHGKYRETEADKVLGVPMEVRFAQAVIDVSAALQGVMDLIEAGVLVRDTSNNHEPGWAMKQIPLVQALARAKTALDGKDLT